MALTSDDANHGIGSAAGESVGFLIDITNARSASLFTLVDASASCVTNGFGDVTHAVVGGHFQIAEVHDAVRILPLTAHAVSAGNFPSGTFVLEGLAT